MKKLIYFTLGGNYEYLELAKLCIESLYDNDYDGDFLFITDYEDVISSSIIFKKNPFFLNVRKSDLLESAGNKFKIYQFSEINNYDKIIYSDLDILWLSNPEKIFDLITEDKFYVSNEQQHPMSHVYWGGPLLTNEEIEEIVTNNIFGINSGIFAFNKNMIKHLEKIDNYFINNLQYVDACLEQPYFNVYLYRNKLYDVSLTSILSHNGCNLDSYDGFLLHFAGGPGYFQNKYTKMLNFYNKNFKK